jgi:hypothetical protein
LAMIIYCFIGGLVATITVLIGEECVKDFDNCAILLLCLAWPSFIPIYIMKTIIAIFK